MILAVLANQPGSGAQHRRPQCRRGDLRLRRGGVAEGGRRASAAVIASGEAKRKLDEFVAFTQKLKLTILDTHPRGEARASPPRLAAASHPTRWRGELAPRRRRAISSARCGRRSRRAVRRSSRKSRGPARRRACCARISIRPRSPRATRRAARPACPCSPIGDFFQGAAEHLVGRARCLPAAGRCARTSSSTRIRCTRRARIGADCILLIAACLTHGRNEGAGSRRRTRSAWRCWWKCTMRPSSSARLALEHAAPGHQQPRPADFRDAARNHARSASARPRRTNRRDRERNRRAGRRRPHAGRRRECLSGRRGLHARAGPRGRACKSIFR